MEGDHESQGCTRPAQTSVPHALPLPPRDVGACSTGLGQGVGRRADGPSPGFLLTQGYLLSEVIKELPSLHPVGTEGL